MATKSKAKAKAKPKAKLKPKPKTSLQEFLALRTRIAENALENMMGYSRSLYEVASEAQGELSKLAEERMSSFQKAVSETVDQAAKSAPAGGDLAAAAIKSSLAATTAAFAGKSRLERQRLVYGVLADELKERVHALALKLSAPGET